ncbi:kinase-like protein [Trichoderma cornu-damae]|uniref:Kinase-like protein n=1 Tax=Trichoderma cornu-damae TaxID=654480 RepID=A0A9P8TT44_9HYPO|nr:kinase-like protein [Trichoderma cornu-damae]
MFSEQETYFFHGLDDVIRAVTTLGLCRYRYEDIAREEKILRHRPLRNHSNFPYAFGYGWNMNNDQIVPYLLVRYAPKGTLRQYLKSMLSPISRRDLQILAGDVAPALSALHKCGIAHGDIKLDNVLVIHS